MEQLSKQAQQALKTIKGLRKLTLSASAIREGERRVLSTLQLNDIVQIVSILENENA